MAQFDCVPWNNTLVRTDPQSLSTDSDGDGQTVQHALGCAFFGLETRELLLLPTEIHDDHGTWAHLRSGLDDAHPLSKVLDQCASLAAPDRALKMSAALLVRQDVGVEWDSDVCHRFMGRLLEDMTQLRTECPEVYEKVAANLLQAWPLLRNDICADGMGEHAAFALAAECLAQQPDKWVDEMLRREPRWLEHAATMAAGSDVANSATASPVSSRVAAILSGEALSGPRRLQAHTAVAIAAAEHCAALAPNGVAHGTALERVRTLTKKALAGDYGNVPPPGWRELFRAWATLIRCVGDAAVAGTFSAGPEDWAAKCLRPLDTEMRPFVRSTFAARNVAVALELAKALQPTQAKPLAGSAELALLRIARECLAMAEIWDTARKDATPQLLVAPRSSAKA